MQSGTHTTEQIPRRNSRGGVVDWAAWVGDCGRLCRDKGATCSDDACVKVSYSKIVYWRACIVCQLSVIVLFVLHGSGAGDPVRPLAVLLVYRTLSDEEKTDQCYEKRRRETSAESWSV